MYSFTYSLNRDDYLEFNKSHFNAAPSNKKYLPAARLFVPLAFIALLIYFYMRDKDMVAALMAAPVYAMLSAIWFFALKPLEMAGPKIGNKNAKRDGELPYRENVKLFFDGEGICGTSETGEETGEVKIWYAGINRVVENANAIYIYFSAVQAFIIPCSVFESAEQKDGFLTFINGKRLAKPDGTRDEIPAFEIIKEEMSRLKYLLSLPGVDVNWSSYGTAMDVINDLESLEKEIISLGQEKLFPGKIASLDENAKNKLLFLLAPTGDLQEISLSSGWGAEFCDIAAKLEEALKRV